MEEIKQEKINEEIKKKVNYKRIFWIIGTIIVCILSIAAGVIVLPVWFSMWSKKRYDQSVIRKAEKIKAKGEIYGKD